MADTDTRGIAPSQRQDVGIPGVGLSNPPGVASRPVPIALPGAPNPDMSAATSLMRALDVSTGNFDAFGKEYLKEDREEQFKLGQMKAQESQEKFADAVAKGVIPATANPWFIKGYQNQDGRVQGLDYYSKMQSAYLSSPAKGNDDPAAYEKFSKDFKKQYMASLPTDKSADWWGGFQQSSTTADERMSREHAENVQQAVIAKQQTNTGAEINVILNSTRDPKEAAERINALGDKMRLEGMPPQAYQEVAAQAILAKAKMGDPNFLATLDYVKTGGKDSPATLSSNPKVAQARVEASQWLIDKARSAQEFAWAQDNHRYQIEVVRPRAEEAYQHEKQVWDRQAATWGREDQSRSLLAQIQARTMASPETAYAETRPILDKLSQVNPTMVPEAVAFQKAYLSNTDNVPRVVEAPVEAGFRDQIIRLAGNREAQLELMRDMNNAMIHNSINRSTYQNLVTFSQEMANYEPTNLRKLQSPELEKLKNDAKGYFTDFKTNPLGALYGKGLSDYNATLDAINTAAMDLLKRKPDASSVELREAGEKALKAMLPTLVPGNTGGTLDDLGRKAEQTTRAPAPPTPTSIPLPAKPDKNAPAPTEMEKALAKPHPADKAEVVKEAAAAYAKGPQTFQQFIMETDRQLGVPGLTAKIIEEAHKRATTPQGKSP